MIINLPRRFIKIARNQGIRYALKSTADYLKINRIRRQVHLQVLRLISGDDIIREINGSDMELDIRSDSLNRIERTLAVDGIREPGVTKVFQNVLLELKNQSQTPIHVFDIGANIGYFALMEANILGELGNIYAIEADPNNATRLEQNVKLNNYDNIEVLQIAIGAGRSQLELAQRSSSNVHRMKEILGDEQSIATTDVEVYPLDSLIAEKEIPYDEPIIVRMDIEGYESYAFKGMNNLIKSKRSVYLFIEIHPNVKHVDPEQIADILTQNNFQPEYISYNGGEKCQEMNSLEDICRINTNAHILLKRFPKTRNCEQ